MRLGIASTAFLGSALGRHSATSEHSRQVMSLPPVPSGGDTIDFLERCHALGAAGIQSQISGDPHRLRERAEQLGMWIEAMISVRNTTPEWLDSKS